MTADVDTGSVPESTGRGGRPGGVRCRPPSSTGAGPPAGRSGAPWQSVGASAPCSACSPVALPTTPFAGRLTRPEVDWLVMEARREPDRTRRKCGRVLARRPARGGLGDLRTSSGRAPRWALLRPPGRLPVACGGSRPRPPATTPRSSRAGGRGDEVSNAHVNSLPIAEFVLRAVLDEFQERRQWRYQAASRRGGSTTGARWRAPRG